MDGALGRGSSRNAGNLAALASLLPRPAATGDMESPKSDKSTGRETLGGGPQRSSSAPGRIGPAGNPQRLGGSDSPSKASLLGCLIVRDEGLTPKDDGVQHLPDVGAEEPKDKPMDEKEGGSENEEVFGGDSPKNVEGLFSTPHQGSLESHHLPLEGFQTASKADSREGSQEAKRRPLERG